MEQRWFDANNAMWDERVPIHVASRFYDVDRFRRGEREAIETWEADEMGPVDGLTLLHLQCHFGLDTLSWARRGATVTGLDFSAPAVASARQLADDIGTANARFVHANLYDAPETLDGETFDVVYTGKGALCWLPDIDRWAQVCAALVKPGGWLYVSEFHPFTDVFGWKSLAVEYSYFRDEPLFDDSHGTYTDFDAPTVHNDSYQWFHPIGRIVSAICAAGLQIEFLRERPTTVFQRWPFLLASDDGVYRLPDGQPEIPLMFSLKASKPAEASGR